MLTLLDHPSFQSARISGDGAPAPDGYRTLAAGEMLFREGEPRSHVYRVEKGSICLFKARADGSQHVLEFAFPGDLVGLGYLDNHVSGAQATMETSLSCLPRSALEPTIENPSTKSRLTAAIEREVAFLKETHARAGRPKALERIAALFVTLARCNAYEGRDPSILTDSLSCGVVAGYLDMSVDELARCLTELEALNLVEAAPKGLRLKNLDELERLADAGD
jgi:CRP/FNR family transcriptional regulator